MDVRSRILTAAAALYGETGFRGATTRRIAERAGVNEVTLFRHFGYKTCLLREAIRCAGVAPDFGVLPSRPEAPEQELTRWALDTHRELFARRALIRTALGEIEEHPDLMEHDRGPAVGAGLALRSYVGALRAENRIHPGTDTGAATTMFMGALFADAISRDVMPDMYPDDADTSVRRYVDLFCRAIGLRERVS
jgi:AcrR family transcriptional regulator